MTAVTTLSLTDFTHGDPATRTRFEADLLAGLKECGFIILTDHGVPVDLLDRAYGLAAEVFALPREEKTRSAGGMRGYTPFGTEHAKGSALPDLKEFWQVGREVPDGAPYDPVFPPNIWPAALPEFEPVFSALFAALEETGRVMLQALAPGLGLEREHFDRLIAGGPSLLRVLHYPPVGPDVPAGAVRAAAHEDINFITLLVAARGAGLELLDRHGNWLPVETPPGNLIIDSGDMLARLTNGVIPATTHRVVNPVGPNVDRYSMPFFLHPRNEVSLAPVASCLGDGPKWPVMTAGEYLRERLGEIGMAG
jgi:isopenicillin N synthase-like dioxygenase